MKIGIIGCGYVGQAMALRWKLNGHYLSTTTRQAERVSFLETISDDVFLIPSQNFDSYIQQLDALLISVAPSNSTDNYASTYLETANLIFDSLKHTPYLHQILYTSSTSVYGDHEGAWVDEETPLTNLQGNKKILYETEQILLNCQSKDRKVCIFRLGEIYGPGREIQHRIRRMQQQQQTFAGTGESYTNLIHLTDIVEALNFALQNKLQGIYNLCSDFHIPRNQFYARICQAEELPPIKWDSSRPSLHGGNRKVANKKIKEAGFTFSHPDFFTE